MSKDREFAASEASLHMIINMSPDAVMVLSTAGIILFANPAAERLFERPAAKMIGTEFGFPVLGKEITEIEMISKNGMLQTAEMRLVDIEWEGEKAILLALRDITDRKLAEEALHQYSAELEKKNQELQDALANVKQLSGMLPICASCKKIRDDKGYWSEVESYISGHTETVFSHGLCPDCEKKAYEDLENLTNKNA